MKLTVYQNSRELQVFDFSEEVRRHSSCEIFIGRALDCHIILEDPRISRYHAVVRFGESGAVLESLSDFASVELNGLSTKKSELKNDDLFKIHDFTFRVSGLEEKNFSPAKPGEQDLASAGELGDVSQDPILSEDEAPQELTPQEDEFESDTQDYDLSSSAPIEMDDEDGVDIIEDDLGALESEQEFTQETNVENEFDGGVQPPEFESEPLEESVDGTQDFEQFSSDDNDFAPMEMDSGESTQVLQDFVQFDLKLQGPVAPYDKFKLQKSETIIGRDPTCDIRLNEDDVSSKHAAIKKIGGLYVLEDLGSSNGTHYKGERINQVELSSGDVFRVGTTEFFVEVRSEQLEAEKEQLMPVDFNQEVTREEIVDEVVDFAQMGTQIDASNDLAPQKGLANPANRRRLIIYGAVFGLFALLYLTDESDSPSQESEVVADNKNDSKQAPSEEEKKKLQQAQEQNRQRQFDRLSDTEKAEIEAMYNLARSFFDQGEYEKAIQELEKIRVKAPFYKKTQQLFAQSKEGLAEIERLEQERKAEEQRRVREKKVAALLEKAKKAVEDKEIVVAEGLFSQIYELDPENLEVEQLKMQLEAYQKEQERIALEKAQEEAERERQLQALAPGKKLFLQNKWYEAIIELGEFLEKENIDEDLVSEASEMMKKSRKELDQAIDPLLDRARSYKENANPARAYETYQKILSYDPSNEESLNESNRLKELLVRRAKKIYRESLIVESLSLFQEAKRGFMEVKKQSPQGSEYYNKASEKLKDYLD